jgi:tRNA-dihydrouridine synthase
MSIQRTISFTIKDNTYELRIPNNGQLIDIESMKQMLSKGMYRAMNNTGTVNTAAALDIIDMTAMFTVLCPKLVKDLNVTSLLDLDILDSQELIQVYREQVAEWIISWQRLMTQYFEQTRDETETKDTE